jgi:hypothetical protein
MSVRWLTLGPGLASVGLLCYVAGSGCRPSAGTAGGPGGSSPAQTITWMGQGGGIGLVRFSPDSKALATFVPGTLKIWSTAEWDGVPNTQE